MRVTLKLSDVVASDASGMDGAGAVGTTCVIGADFRGGFATALLGVVMETTELVDTDWLVLVDTPTVVLTVCTVDGFSFTADSNPTHCGWKRSISAPTIIPIAPILASNDFICGDIAKIYVALGDDSRMYYYSGTAACV